MNEHTKATLLFALSIIYLLSPIDFMPDAVPLLGNADDLIAIYIGMNRYLRSKLVS